MASIEDINIIINIPAVKHKSPKNVDGTMSGGSMHVETTRPKIQKAQKPLNTITIDVSSDPADLDELNQQNGNDGCLRVGVGVVALVV